MKYDKSITETAALFRSIALHKTFVMESRLDEGEAWDAIKKIIGAPIRGVKSVSDAYDKLLARSQKSEAVQNFDVKVDKLIDGIGNKNPQLKDKVVKYAEWAKKHPIKQSFILAALVAVAAAITGPGGGAAAGFILRAANELIKGEKASTAIGKGAKGALAGAAAGIAAGAIFKPLANMLGDLIVKSIPFNVKGVTQMDIGGSYTMQTTGAGRAVEKTISGKFFVLDKDAAWMTQKIAEMKQGSVSAFLSVESYVDKILHAYGEAGLGVKQAFEAARQDYSVVKESSVMLNLLSAVKKALPALAQGAATSKDMDSPAFKDIAEKVKMLPDNDKQQMIKFLQAQS